MRYMLLGMLVLVFNVHAEEKLFVKLDDRPWKIGYQEQANDSSILEMILEGDSILDWSELFTVQSFSGLPIGVDEFVEAFKAQSSKGVPAGQRATFKLVEKAPFYIIENSFYSQTSADNSSNEYNLGRIIKQEDQLYYIRYSTKNEKQFDKVKEAWINRLKEAYVANSPKEGQEASSQWLTISSEEVTQGAKKLTYKPETELYVDEESGFGLPIPSDWLVLNEEANQEAKDKYSLVLLFTNSNQTVYGGVAYDKKKEGEPLPDFWGEYKKAAGKEAKIIKEGKIQTALGLTGSYLIIEKDGNTGWITFFNDPDRIYRLELWSSSEQFEKNKALFEQVITNFIISP